MDFCLIFVFIISHQVCSGEVRFNAAELMPSPPPSIPSKCTNKSIGTNSTLLQSNALQFRLPFMDMNIQNERNLHIMQEIKKQQLYVLHGNELYELIVSREEKRLTVIGVLAGSVRHEEALAAKVIFWRNYLLLVIALEDYLEIYQLPAIVLAHNAEAAKMGHVNLDTITKFEPIQQLTINGRFRKLFLVNVGGERVMLLTAENYTKLQSKLRTYEWSNTFFDLVEDLTLPAIHILEVIGTVPKYLLSGRLIKHQGRTITVLHEIDANDLHIRNRQTITIPSRNIHAFTFRRRNYLIGCMTATQQQQQQQQRCSTFRMKRDEAQFSIYRQSIGKDLTFERFTAGENFLVGTNQRSVNVYPNVRMDCYASFTTNESDISEIIAHVSQNGETFALLNYRRTFQTLLRLVEIETAKGERLGMAAPDALNDTDTEGGVEDLNALQQHHHLFESTIQQLRSLLLKRRPAMDTFRRAAAILRPKLQELKLDKAVRLLSGNIGIVRISGDVLQSPMQLMRRVEELRAPQRSVRLTRETVQAAGFILNVPHVAKVKRLHVGSLLYNGTLLEGFYLSNDPSSPREPILSAPAEIRTKVLSTSHLQIQRHDTNSSDVTPFKVRDLSVDRINDVSVKELFDSVFLRNRDRKLKGRLVISGATKVHTLQTPLLNNWVVAELFNLKEPQVVRTKLLFASITVKDMNADLVNGLNFTEDIVFSGRDDVIEGPVEIQQMIIVGDLLVDYKPRADHAEEDTQFLQFYTGKVIINGSLTVDNLERDHVLATAITVNGAPFSEAMLRDKYLLENTHQDIFTAVRFGNAKVTTPKFTTRYLNDHATMQHLLTTAQPEMGKPLILIFMRAQVDGDVICNDYKSKLREISEDVVRHGELAANITGMKVFEAGLTMAHLKSDKFNQLQTNDLILKEQLLDEFHFHGNKSFDKLFVIGDANIVEALNTAHLNEENIEPTIHNHNFKQLTLPHHLRAHNVVIRKINDIPFDTIFDRLSVENEQLVLHKDLLFKGNVEFVGNLQVKTINDIVWNDYVENLVRLNENALIENGTIHFAQGLTIKSGIRTPLVNDFKLQEVFDNVLLKSKPQEITGNYTFGSLRLTNLDVSIINDVHTETFIDTRAEELTLHGDLIIPKLTVHGDVSGNFVNTFHPPAITDELHQVSQRHWRNLVVLGNATWNTTSTSKTKQYEQMEYLYRHAVRQNGDQVISGAVHMAQPLISKMRTSTQFPPGVDLNYIAHNCLLKNTTMRQTINASKLFHKPLRMQRVIAEGPLAITFLNGIDVQRIDESLYRLSTGLPITGPLCFKVPPFFGQMIVEGLVNSMLSAPIYTTSRAAMPPVTMHALEVEHELHIGDVNAISLDYLLKQRMRLNGEPQELQGFLIFENDLVLNNETLLQSINGISIDNLIYKKSDNMQMVGEQKDINGSLIFNGPAAVLHLNGQQLQDLYKKSIFIIGNYHFDNLTIDQGTFVKGLVLVGNMLSSTDVGGEARAAANASEEDADALTKNEELLSELQNENATSHRAQLTAAVRELSDLLTTQNSSADTRHLLYLDYDINIEIAKHYANESVRDTYFYDLQHLSMCQHQLLQLQIAQNHQRFFITNITTSLLTAHSGAISVKVQNYCDEQQQRKVKSKISVNGRTLERVFGMKKFIESLQIFAAAGVSNRTFLLLHAIDEARNRNEIRVMRIDDAQNDIRDWQTIQFGIGKTMHLFKIDNFTALVSAAVVSNQPALSIYHFNQTTEHFKLTQAIDGPYDVVEMVAVERDHYQLLLSCHKCHYIHVYDLNSGDERLNPYKFVQIIKLPTRIDKLQTFTIADGELFLLALSEQQQDFFYLYRYAFVEGWVQHTVGYFPNIEMAVPLSGLQLPLHHNYLALLLVCGGGGEVQRCSVVSAFTQG